MPLSIPSGREVRSFHVDLAGLSIETRAEGKQVLVGHAAVFNQWTDLRWYRERILPGAFKNALKEKQDVRALFNHDSNFVLGRTASGTLRLWEDDIGLAFEIDPPDSQTIRDLVLTPITRKDVDGNSFAFLPRGKAGAVWRTIEGEDGVESYERDLVDLNLFDVGPVTYPAYKQTDLALRSDLESSLRDLDEFKASRAVEAGRRRSAIARIDLALLPPGV